MRVPVILRVYTSPLDRVGAGISLLGRGCGALGAESANKTSKRAVSTFCPLLTPARNRTSPLSCRLASCHEPLGSELRLASLEWRSDSERWRLATLSQ